MEVNGVIAPGYAGWAATHTGYRITTTNACWQLIKGVRVALPPDGQLPAQRSRPTPQLERKLRRTARLLFFECIWSVICLLVPLALRGRIRPSAIRLPQCGIWMGTLLLLPRLSYFLLSLSFLGLLGCVFLEGLYVALGFTDFDDSWDDSTKKQFWAALGLYVAEVLVDAVSTLLLGPLIVYLHRLETRPAPATAAASPIGVGLVVVDGSAAPAAPAAGSGTRQANGVLREARRLREQRPAGAGPPAPAPAPAPRPRPAQPTQSAALPVVVHEDTDDADDPLATVPEFKCSITLSVMRDPVIAADGHSYEREALEAWLRSHRTSPLTGARLEHMHVTPNHRLRSLIESARSVARQI